MSLNNISLPSQLLADLYRNSLVEGIATPVPVKQITIPYLGKNGKNILIVVNKPDVPYLPDAELAFFTKVLTACQLGLLDVAIVNGNKFGVEEAMEAITQTAANFVILFDIPPALFGLPAETPLFTVQSAEGRPFVVAPALNKIESTKEAKSQLWLSLKQLFGI